MKGVKPEWSSLWAPEAVSNEQPSRSCVEAMHAGKLESVVTAMECARNQQKVTRG